RRVHRREAGDAHAVEQGRERRQDAPHVGVVVGLGVAAEVAHDAVHDEQAVAPRAQRGGQHVEILGKRQERRRAVGVLYHSHEVDELEVGPRLDEARHYRRGQRVLEREDEDALRLTLAGPRGRRHRRSRRQSARDVAVQEGLPLVGETNRVRQRTSRDAPRPQPLNRLGRDGGGGDDDGLADGAVLLIFNAVAPLRAITLEVCPMRLLGGVIDDRPNFVIWQRRPAANAILLEQRDGGRLDAEPPYEKRPGGAIQGLVALALGDDPVLGGHRRYGSRRRGEELEQRGRQRR